MVRLSGHRALLFNHVLYIFGKKGLSFPPTFPAPFPLRFHHKPHD